jgi:hypothetical protein
MTYDLKSDHNTKTSNEVYSLIGLLKNDIKDLNQRAIVQFTNPFIFLNILFIKLFALNSKKEFIQLIK